MTDKKSGRAVTLCWFVVKCVAVMLLSIAYHWSVFADTPAGQLLKWPIIIGICYAFSETAKGAEFPSDEELETIVAAELFDDGSEIALATLVNKGEKT